MGVTIKRAQHRFERTVTSRICCALQPPPRKRCIAATELLKRVVTIVEDFAFGYEQMGGFQASFQKEGGCVVNKLWPPIVTPDYTPYVAQISDCDGVCQGFAGSNPLRFMKTYASAGLKYPVITGETGGDDALLKSFGDEAVGLFRLSLHA